VDAGAKPGSARSRLRAGGHERGVSPARRTEVLRNRTNWDQEAESAALLWSV